MITAAFSSNAIDVPSSRPNGFFVRTTTACTTSPFLTAPCGVAVLTVAVITSPDARVAAVRAAHDADAEDLARAGVVGHAQS